MIPLPPIKIGYDLSGDRLRAARVMAVRNAKVHRAVKCIPSEDLPRFILQVQGYDPEFAAAAAKRLENL